MWSSSSIYTYIHLFGYKSPSHSLCESYNSTSLTVVLGRSVNGGKLGKLPLDGLLLERVKGIYFVYFPSDNREEEWKRCVTAINTYLRGKAFKHK